MAQLVWITDEAGNIQYINRRWFEYTGQAPGASVKPEAWLQAIHPDDRARSLQEHQRALRERDTMSLEYRLRAKDGSYRWHLARSVWAPDPDGGPTLRLGTATDIHELRLMRETQGQSEQELLRSRDLLNAILQGVDSGIVAFDPHHRFVFANDAAARMAGYDSAAELMKGGWQAVFHGTECLDERGQAVRAEDLPTVRALSCEKDPPELVVQHRPRNQPNTPLKWSIVRSVPVFDAAGRISLVISIFRDFTARKQAELEREGFHEQALLERARLLAVIRQVETGVLILDGRTQEVVFANDKIRELWRLPEIPVQPGPRYEALKTYHADGRLVRWEEWPSYRCITEGIGIKGEEYAIRRGDGTHGFVKFSADPIVDSRGKVVAAVVTQQDVTELRRQAQNASFLDEATRVLASSLDYRQNLNAVARLAVPQLGDWCSIALVEQQGPEYVALANPDSAMVARAHEFSTRYPTDWNGKGSAAYVLRTGEPLFLATVTEEMLEKGAVDAEHLRLMRGMGVHSVILVPFRSHEVTYGVLTLVSSRERGTFDAADFNLAQELARRAGQAIENAKLYEQAQRAIHSRDALISVSAHELLTPVSGSKLQMQLMRKRMEQGQVITPEQVRKMVDQTERQLDRLNRLVTEMLDLSRINLGKLTLQREKTDLSGLVNDLLERMSGQLQAAGCTVKSFVEPGIQGRIDSYRIEQVLSNLLSNATRYARGKPVTVRLARSGAEAAVLSVQDEGIGIRREDHERVFERFERAASVDEGSGLGLGLFVVRQIVEAHGGSVGLESEPGHGSKFSIWLPLREGIKP